MIIVKEGLSLHTGVGTGQLIYHTSFTTVIEISKRRPIWVLAHRTPRNKTRAIPWIHRYSGHLFLLPCLHLPMEMMNTRNWKAHKLFVLPYCSRPRQIPLGGWVWMWSASGVRDRVRHCFIARFARFHFGFCGFEGLFCILNRKYSKGVRNRLWFTAHGRRITF